jgi:hypothetical protein
MTKEQVFVFLPPLEQAPDQIASRPSDTDSVILVPALKDPVSEAPFTTASTPDGLEDTVSPLRPVAETFKVNDETAGVTMSVPCFVIPAALAVMVTVVAEVTEPAMTVKSTLV